MVRQIELAPGIRLHAIKTDRFKTGCFSINLICPLVRETAAWNALLPSVLLRGCRNYPDISAISSHLDQMYGASVGTLVRKKGEVQTIGLYADFLEDCFCGEPLFAQMMEFIRQLLMEPCLEGAGFVDEAVAGEKTNLINAIDSVINDKRSYAHVRLLKHMCADEAYCIPRLGEAETLETVNGRNLYAYYQKLLSTSRVELFYMGRQPAEKVAEELKPLLAELPNGYRTDISADCKGDFPQNVRYVEEKLNVTQGKLTIGIRTDILANDRAYPALMVANAIFGGGMNSRLFLKIREEQSLCYYASSSVDKYKGVMLVDSGIEFSNYEVARDGILRQLDLCKQGQITEEELQAARTYLLTALRAALDSPARLDDFVIGQAIAGTDVSVENLMKEIEAVTMEQVVGAFQTLHTDTVYFLKGVEG